MYSTDSAAVQIYRVTARLLLPRAHRREFGVQSLEAFVDLDRAAAQQGVRRRLRLLGRELAALLRFGVAERYRPRRAGGGMPVGQGPPEPVDQRWFGAVILGDLRDDLRFTVRLLLKERAFTITAVATLAIGIAATAAIFTILNGVLLRPLPYADSDSLVQVWTLRPADADQRETTTSNADYVDLRAQTSSLRDLGAHNLFFATVSGVDEPERIMGGLVTVNLFDVLGVAPMLGSAFTAAHEVPGQDEVVVLSYGFWQRHFGGDPLVVGESVRLNERPFRVLGVMPMSYRHPDPHRPLAETQVFIPFAWDAEDLASRGNRSLRLVGRLNDGVAVETAARELNAIEERLAEAYPETNKGRGATAVAFREQFFGELAPMLWLIQAAAGMVLLIVCANIANLVLVRGQRRRAEFAVRSALGAGGPRLARQLVVESGVLAAMGGLVGLVIVALSQDLLRQLGSRYLPRLADTRVDANVVLLGIGLAAAAAIVFALVGALQVAGPGSRAAQRPGAAAASRVSQRLRGSLVAAEIALTVALVICASLLARSLVALASVPPGFDRAGALTLEVAPPRSAYPEATELNGYYEALGARLGALPGVSTLGFVSDLPFIAENRWTGINFPDRPIAEEDAPSVEFRTIAGDYFGAMGIALRAGRPFGPEDIDGAPMRIVVSETMGEMFWPGESAVGHEVLLGLGEQQRIYTIIGVVSDVLDDGFASSPEPRMYYAAPQRPVRRMTAVIRVDQDPLALAPAARQVVRDFDATVPVAALQTLEQLVLGTLADERFATWLATGFAVVALLVAGLGIYGVMSYLVAARTREIGVRAALGARPAALLHGVLSQTLRLTAVGVVGGVVLGLAASRWLATLLYEIGPGDPMSFVAAPAVLAAVAMIAGYIPARRAARVSPVEALRTE